MVKQVKSRKAARRGPEFSGREIWLAGLGAAALTRKQGARLVQAMLDEGSQLQVRIGQTLESVRARLDETVEVVRERAGSALGEVKGGIESRLEPVLVRFGLRRAPARLPAAGRRSAAAPRRKATARRSRKAA
ncbi:MAG: hypothetical protein KatS3mg126_2144 [Lysobacteraceae bacterium]|nr:MAG: hypothetical protein KatS3mg126_2144 [Xanthomonadaceae bacterium]